MALDFEKLRIETWMRRLSLALNERFPNYVFRFGSERNMETQMSVLIVQYAKLGQGFERMLMDKSAEVFIADPAHDYNKLTGKVIARFMLLGLDEQ